jgi:hypothetical protein
MILERDL